MINEDTPDDPDMTGSIQMRRLGHEKLAACFHLLRRCVVSVSLSGVGMSKDKCRSATPVAGQTGISSAGFGVTVEARVPILVGDPKRGMRGISLAISLRSVDCNVQGERLSRMSKQLLPANPCLYDLATFAEPKQSQSQPRS